MNETSALLERIVTNNETHARFLNTLSMMELCGAEKLARALTRMRSHASTALLEHVAEEFRHAYFLRRQAVKLNPTINDFSSTNVLLQRMSRNYIRELDRRISITICRNLESVQPEIIYVVVTYIIEHRALPFYQLYQNILSRHGIAISVASVISEEASHLRVMTDRLLQENLPIPLLRDCHLVEDELFTRWMSTLATMVH